MGAFITKEKLFSAKWFRAYSFILIGTFIAAVGYVFFITPHKIVPGGIFGIAIVLHHQFNLPIGIIALCFNIPLTIIGLKILGPRFGIKTVLGFILCAGFIDLLTYHTQGEALVESDPLLSAIFGGVLIGIGMGFIFKSKAAAGGSDVIAMIIAKYTKLPLGQLMMLVDSVIVLIALVAFGDWKIPLYSWLALFIMGKVIDVFLQGISYEKALFIISDRYEEIRQKLIIDMKRGGTFIPAKGMFQGIEKNIIFTSVNRREVEILKDYIKDIDPQAFITVVEANEIIGAGFKSLHKND
jgi:uncharacterized membrane-anchored protein YitT (DUF2179 family)